jgi:hypothetical protein
MSACHVLALSRKMSSNTQLCHCLTRLPRLPTRQSATTVVTRSSVSLPTALQRVRLSSKDRLSSGTCNAKQPARLSLLCWPPATPGNNGPHTRSSVLAAIACATGTGARSANCEFPPLLKPCRCRPWFRIQARSVGSLGGYDGRPKTEGTMMIPRRRGGPLSTKVSRLSVAPRLRPQAIHRSFRLPSRRSIAGLQAGTSSGYPARFPEGRWTPVPFPLLCRKPLAADRRPSPRRIARKSVVVS